MAQKSQSCLIWSSHIQIRTRIELSSVGWVCAAIIAIGLIFIGNLWSYHIWHAFNAFKNNRTNKPTWKKNNKLDERKISILNQWQKKWTTTQFLGDKWHNCYINISMFFSNFLSVYSICTEIYWRCYSLRWLVYTICLCNSWLIYQIFFFCILLKRLFCDDKKKRRNWIQIDVMACCHVMTKKKLSSYQFTHAVYNT